MRDRGTSTQQITLTAGGPRVPYARIQEFGGIVRAKRAPYLVFRIGSRWFSKRSVKLPARRYLGRAVDEVQRTAPARMAEALAVDFIEETS